MIQHPRAHAHIHPSLPERGDDRANNSSGRKTSRFESIGLQLSLDTNCYKTVSFGPVFPLRPWTPRSVQLLPGGGPAQRLAKLRKGSLGVGGVSRDSYGAPGEDGAKYIHCVEEPGQGEACGDNGGAGVGVVIEWARRAAATAGGADIQEVLVKCRVGQFPSHKSFYLIVSGAWWGVLLTLARKPCFRWFSMFPRRCPRRQ